MRKDTSNKGFAVVEALIVVAVVVALGVVGAIIYHQGHKTKINTTNSQTGDRNSTQSKSPPDPYAGWKTYTVGSTGLSFKYPADWTVSDSPQCEGADGYSIKAPTSELSGISTSPVDEALTSYSLGIAVNPTSGGCTNYSSLQDVPLGAQSHSQVITTGALKGKYLMVNGTTADGTSQTYVLNSNYNAGQKISETGLVTTTNGVSLQVAAGIHAGQDIGDADVSSFLGSQLYKDTVSILSSLDASSN